MSLTVTTGEYTGTGGEQIIDIGFQPTKVVLTGFIQDLRPGVSGDQTRRTFLVAHRPPGSSITALLTKEDERMLAEDPNASTGVRRMAITSNGFRVIDHDNRVLTPNTDGATYWFQALQGAGGSTQAQALASLRPGLLNQLADTVTGG